MPRGPLLPAAALAAALAMMAVAPLGAQEPDTLRDRRGPDPVEERPVEPGDTTRPEPPPPTYVPPRFALSVAAGTHGFDRLQSQPMLAHRRDAAGAVLDSAVLGRVVEAEGGYRVGVSGVFSPGPAWGTRLGVSIARTTIRPEYEGEAALFAATAAQLAASEATDATVVALEAALRMRIPSSRRAQPYLELGASAIRWSAAAPVAGAGELAEGILRLAGVAAAGVDIPLSARLAVQLQGTTRVFRTPVAPAPAGSAGAAGSTLTLTFAGPASDPFADGAQELVTALRLDLGISLGLGAPAASPPDPAAPDASPSPSVR